MHHLLLDLEFRGKIDEKYQVLLRVHIQFVVEGMEPDLLHVIPVGDNAILVRILQAQRYLSCSGLCHLCRSLSSLCLP